MVIKRYGKSSASLLLQKTSFFDANELHVKKQREIAVIYRKQPRRASCKNCDARLGLNYDFIKDEIEYMFCNHCHHLNGKYEDTDEFCKVLYTADLGLDYAENYKAEDMASYNYRVASIYLPKAEFLYSSLLDNNINPHKLKYFDFGAGSGYFVAALKKVGLKYAYGTEVSRTQADFGNVMIGEKCLTVHKLEESIKILRETTSQIVSMIGVLEHMQYPRKALRQLKNNDNVRFLYISVPVFSLSVYLEILSPEIFHRQLGGAHTHLYTKESLSHLCQEFGFDITAEWWFGTDTVDLYRSIMLALEKTRSSKRLTEKWRQDFISVIDAVQLEMDKRHLSSEVHMLLKKPNL